MLPERTGDVAGKCSEKMLEQKHTRQGPAATLPGTGSTTSLSVIIPDVLGEPTPTQQKPEK